jgi:hypothetical protein
MLALSGLVLATMLLSTPAARAGHWVFTCTGNGSAHATANGSDTGDQSWTAPTGSSSGNSYSIPPIGFAPTSASAANATLSSTADISATITLTWTHDAGQTDANDPAPPSLWLSESGSAQWTAQSSAQGGTTTTGTGTANDGIGDTPVDVLDANGVKSGQIATSTTAPTSPPPGMHLFKQAVSGVVVTLTRTFHADATATVGPPVNGGPGGYTIGAVIGQYSVSIHAQPYNFRQTQVTDNGDGTLSFTYHWLSTDGQLSHIGSGCVVHEFVTYQGPNPFPLPAPFVGSINNPTVLPDPPQQGSAGVIYDDQLMPSTAKPYQSATVISTQKWEYDDSATGELDVVVPGPDSGPLSITRTIGVRPPYIPYWWYSVNKNGTTAWAPLTGQ